MKIRRFLASSVAAALLSLTLAGGADAAPGGLTQKAGTAGCVSDTGAGPCADGTALDQAFSVTIAPDGATAYAAAGTAGAISTFDRNPITGALTQRAGTAGCVSENGTAGACIDGVALQGANSVVISPDGANAYVASFSANAVAVFDRNPTTGALTQKAGTAGCISQTGTAGACADGTALNGPVTVALSPDGASVYASALSSDAVAIFDRNPTTGALTQKAGTAGCISDSGTGGLCADGVALDTTFSVAVSPDGANAYVASLSSNAVTVFDRNPTTGALTQKAGTAGCASETGAGPCTDGTALSQALGVTVSPDGANIYVTSQGSNAVATFDRNISTGALTQKAGTAACTSETGTAGACSDGAGLVGADAVAVSPDGASAYVSSGSDAAVAVFDRNISTGTLTQKTGTAACVSETGTAGACADGTALAGPDSVTVSPDGRNVYLSASDSDAISIFDRDLAPETTIDSGPSGLTSDSTPSFGFSSGDAGSTFECKVDDGPFGACSGPGAGHTTFALVDGPHGFQVRAIDPAATLDPTPATSTFTVDTEGPETAVTKKPKAKLKTRKPKAKVAVSFSSEAGATFECRLDQAEFTPCSSPFTAKAKSKGGNGKKHEIEVQATDSAGNPEITPAIVKFKLVRK